MSATAEAGVFGAPPQVIERTIKQTRLDLGLDESGQFHALCSASTDIPVFDRTNGCICPRPGEPWQVPINMSNADLLTMSATPWTEREKYMRMWAHPEYRQVAPGEHVAIEFLAHARPPKGAVVIDFGAGTGRGALMMALMGGVQVEMLDFADNCLDTEVRQALETQKHALRFTQHDLTTLVPLTAPYGFCTDVMEHIPPADVDRVLTNILRSAQHVFFQISCVDDVCGALIGQPLHLSVHPFAWWAEKFRALDCQIHYSQDRRDTCVFYVTAWTGGADLCKAGVLNVELQQIKANVLENARGPWINIQPHEPNDMEVMILGGGPSLNGQLEKIRELRAAGVKLVTLNGTYNWALEHELKVSATVVVDAREFNARFTHPVQEETKYLISSQVHPAVLEGLPIDRTYLWHTQMVEVKEALDEEWGPKNIVWWSVFGGSTVMLRAIPLLRILGFRKFHLFGFDSCLSDQAHHAYAQPENDRDVTIGCTVGDRVFQCHPWMVSQAQEFMDMTKHLGDETQIEVYGDGLIAHILSVGAAKADFLT